MSDKTDARKELDEAIELLDLEIAFYTEEIGYVDTNNDLIDLSDPVEAHGVFVKPSHSGLKKKAFFEKKRESASSSLEKLKLKKREQDEYAAWDKRTR